MKPIKLIYHGFDIVIDKHWSTAIDAFVIGDRTVVDFDADEKQLWVYVFPQSLIGKDSIDYYQVDNRIKKFEIFFNGFNNWHTFNLSQPFEKIIIDLIGGN